MASKVKKVQLQARRQGRSAEADWFPALLNLLVSDVEGARWLAAKSNDMIFEYRVVPASQKISGY